MRVRSRALYGVSMEAFTTQLQGCYKGLGFTAQPQEILVAWSFVLLCRGQEACPPSPEAARHVHADNVITPLHRKAPAFETCRPRKSWKLAGGKVELPEAAAVMGAESRMACTWMGIKTLNPETLNPTPRNPKTLNPRLHYVGEVAAQTLSLSGPVSNSPAQTQLKKLTSEP